jgi:Thioredoxin like C-terminal domain
MWSTAVTPPSVSATPPGASRFPRWVLRGMDEGFRRVKQIELRVQILLGIFAAYGVLRAPRWRAAAAAHGSDVDDQGNGTVTEQRLYQLIRQPMPITDRLFEIEFLDAGVEAYAFTFG